MAIYFLIDESDSGPRECGLQAVNRHAVPLYFMELMQEVLGENASRVYLGIGQFATGYYTLLPPVAVPRLAEDEIYAKWHGLTEVTPDARSTIRPDGVSSFPLAIQEAGAELARLSDVETRLLVILSDGFFNNIPDDAAAVAGQIAALHQRGVEVMVGLLCPSQADLDYQIRSLMQWRERVMPLEGATILGAIDWAAWEDGKPWTWFDEDPKQWLSTLLIRTADLLPAKSAWIDGEEVKWTEHGDEIEFPSYAKTILEFRAFTGDQGIRVTDLGDREYLLLGNLTATLVPLSDCSAHSLEVAAKSKEDSGFFWTRSHEPEFEDPVLDVGPLVNNQSVGISMTIRPGDPNSLTVDELTALAPCYIPEVRILLDLPSDTQPAQELLPGCSNTGLCPTGKAELTATWKWHPPQFMQPQSVPLVGTLRKHDEADPFLIGDVSDLHADFVPEPVVDLPPIRVPATEGTDGLLDRVVIEVSFEFVAKEAHVTMFTEKTEAELAEIGEVVTRILGSGAALCPFTKEFAADVPLEAVTAPPGGAASNRLFHTIQTEGTKATYAINMPRYVFDKQYCGYDRVVFKWTDGPVYVWDCSPDRENSNCRKASVTDR